MLLGSTGMCVNNLQRLLPDSGMYTRILP